MVVTGLAWFVEHEAHIPAGPHKAVKHVLTCVLTCVLTRCRLVTASVMSPGVPYTLSCSSAWTTAATRWGRVLCGLVWFN